MRRRVIGAGALLATAMFVAACASVTPQTDDAAAPKSLRTAVADDGGTQLGNGLPVPEGSAMVSGGSGASAKSSAKASKAAKAAAHKSATPSATSQSASPTSGATEPVSNSPGQDPSGQDPSTTLSGFSLKYVQEFNGDSIPANWDAYNGTPGGNSPSVAHWSPDMCTFSGGEAHFMASGIDSCGLQYYGSPQIYGAWFARLKANSQPSGTEISNIFLLFPASNDWPPEIDIYEDGGGRSETSASMYNTVGGACGSSPTSQCLAPYADSNGQSGGVSTDVTQWHTYGVEWTPSGVTWFIDGRVVYSAPASAVHSPAAEPDTQMFTDLQSQNVQGSNGAPAGYESMTVDWVEQYSLNG